MSATDTNGQIDLLEAVLAKTGDVMAGVRAEHWQRPTPCTEWDVEALVNHVLGWVRVFEAASRGERYEGDPFSYEHGSDPEGEFREPATSVVRNWRAHGFDRQVHLIGSDFPATVAFDMTLMEYMTHGSDLAEATDQAVPYTEAEAAETLARAERTLPPQYRGEGQVFGYIVPVPDDAPAAERLAGFMGRHAGTA